MTNVNFVPKDVQTILSPNKISEEYNEHKVFHKNAVLKILQYSQANTCTRISFLIIALLKRDSNTGVFL